MLFFCAWVSHVMLIRVFASVSYILRLCTGYLPGTVFFFFFFFFRFSITMQEKLHLFFYSASDLFFLFYFLSFFLFFFFFFFFLQRARSLVSMLERSRRTQIYGLAIFFKEFLETMGEIYLQGKSIAKTQAVCL